MSFGNISTDTLTANTVITGNGVGGSITGANLISATYIQGNIWSGLYTANVIESDSSLYYSNDRVYSNVIPLLDLKANIVDLTTSNVIELNNLYYSNDRVASYIGSSNLDVSFGNVTVIGNLYINGDINEVNSNVLYIDDKTITIAKGTPTAQLADGAGILIDGAKANLTYSYSGDKFVATKGLDVLNGTLTASNISATSWSGLYTANVIESPSNLYYTNSRAYANLTLASINALVDVDTVTNPPNNGYGLTWNGSQWVPNVITVSATELANVANTVLAIVQGAISSVVANTATFANLSSFANVSGFANLAGHANVSESANVANLVLTLSNFTTANLVENNNSLYYTNARVYSVLTPCLTIKANVTDLTTANVIESNINLYYSNDRVYSNVISLLQGNITLGNVNTDTLTANNIFAASEIITGGGTGGSITGANLITANYIQANIWQELYTANVIETSGNLYFTNDRVFANLTLASIDALADVNTSSVPPVAGNVLAWDGTYWVPSSVVTTVTVSSVDFANVSEFANIAAFANVSDYSNVSGFANISGFANTTDFSNVSAFANVADFANVSGFANVADYANIADFSNVSGFANVSEYANTTAFANVADFANVSGFANISGFANTTSLANVAKFANVSGFANISGFANVAAFANTAGNANLVLSLSNFTTSNLAEGSNLYYTNARVYSNVISLLRGNVSIGNVSFSGSITANGYISTANGLVATSTYPGPYSDGIVVDYITSNGRISVGVADGINFYTGGIANTLLASLSPTGTFTTNNIIAGNTITTGGTNGSITGANLIITNYIQANIWQGIYTANVIESASNLYFTNTRVYANVAPVLALKANVIDLTTSNVVELNNLYYTNTRVYSNVAPLLALKANVKDLTTSNVVELNNLYYTNTRVYSNVAPLLALKANVLDLTTANVVELNNLYYTNSRVASYLTNLNVTLGNTIVGNLFVTGTINEVQSNLLYIEDKAITLGKGATDTGLLDGAGIIIDYANVQFTYQSVSDRMALNKELTLPKISADTVAGLNYTGLYSHNVIEDTNLFYSNDRVYSNISLASINIFADVDTVSQPPNNGYALTWNGSQWVPNVVTVSQTELANVANVVLGIVQGSIVANVAYFSANAGHANVSEQANVANIANVALYSYVAENANIANLVLTLSNFTTSNLAEGSNLYFTNSRVRSNVIALLPTLAGENILIDNNGVISANLSSVTIGTLYTSNIMENGDTTTGNVYFTNTRARAAISAGDNTIFYDEANGTIRANTSVVTTIQTSIETTISNLTTSNVAEGSNLYYTNDRVISAVTYAQLSNISVTGNVVAGNIVTGGGAGGSITGANLISANYIQANVWTGIYTANVIESDTNLYYTNARVISAVTPYLTTANVLELDSNLYYTNARVISAVTPYLTTSNVVETASNLYYSNDRVYSNVISILQGNISFGNVAVELLTANTVVAGNIITGAGIGGRITGANLISANYIQGNIWAGIYTANVIESDTNLYYTNSRVSSYLANSDIGFGNVTVYGNLYVAGDINEVNSTILNVDDKNIIIAKGAPDASFANGAGLLIDGAQANLTYVYPDDKFVINKGLDVLYGTLNVANISAVTWSGLYTANVIESASNLYYTDDRVYANVTALLSEYTGNIHAGNVTTTGAIEYGNVSSGTKVIQVYNSVTNSLDTIFV